MAKFNDTTVWVDGRERMKKPSSSKSSWFNNLSEAEKKAYLEKKEKQVWALKELEKEFKSEYEKLINGLTELKMEDVEKLFRVANQFDNFSFYNSYLILLQNPSSSCVAGNKTWYGNWYKLKKWAQWMKIWIPVKKKVFEKEIPIGETGLWTEMLRLKYGINFNLKEENIKTVWDKAYIVKHVNAFKLSDYNVYDISEVEERYDAEGNSIAKRLNSTTDSTDIELETLSSFISKRYWIQTRFEASSVSKGWFVLRWNDSEIFLNSNLDEVNNTWTLIHEFSHIMLGHTSEEHEYNVGWNVDMMKCLKELEAETLTYLLCKDLWIKRHSDAYLKTWKDWTWIWNEKYKEIFTKVTSLYKRLGKTFREELVWKEIGSNSLALEEWKKEQAIESPNQQQTPVQVDVIDTPSPSTLDGDVGIEWWKKDSDNWRGVPLDTLPQVDDDSDIFLSLEDVIF